VDALSEPEGLVGLSEALIALREELLAAWQEGEDGETGETGSRRLRFRIPEPIELTFQTAVTKKVGANAGVKWWLLSLGGSGGSTLFIKILRYQLLLCSLAVRLKNSAIRLICDACV
jgi:Trypsin-co-occurring domain 2